jgi:ABC-type multidrug transport system ATPase subunit
VIGDSAVIIRNLKFEFNNQREAFGIEIDSLYVKKGKIYFLHGNSGSGKTTFLNLLSGVISNSLMSMVRKEFETIAYVMHESTLLPWCTIKKCISIEERLRGRKINQKLFEELCSQFKLNNDIINTRARHLSLGMRQRLEIAKAIAFTPDLLLLDEAFSGVDNKTKASVLAAVHGYSKENNITLIGTAHQVYDLLRIAENVIIIEEGCILEEIVVDEDTLVRMHMSPQQLNDLKAFKSLINCA